jgi:hypothetical protein
MIACARCQSPIDLHPRVVLRFPKHVARLCDDRALLVDHVIELGAIALEPATQ